MRTARRRRVDQERREGLLRELQDIFLAEGFSALTVSDLTERLHCSRATLYSIAPTKEQLVILATKDFFRTSAENIEKEVANQRGARARIMTYLQGVATAMRRTGPAFYSDMVVFAPTADIYGRNTARAAGRVQELIDEGIDEGEFRSTDGNFAAQIVALAIDAVHSGRLLDRTGLSAADAFNELGELLFNGLLRSPT